VLHLPARSVLFDLLTSIFAIAVVFSDMRKVFLIMALLFIAAGFARGGTLPANGWLKAGRRNPRKSPRLCAKRWIHDFDRVRFKRRRDSTESPGRR
jgi:hypothetical protein